MQKGALAREDFRHERSHGLGGGQNEQEENRDLKNTVGGHQNFSGLSSAYNK
jgi:hypothetical protein